MDTDTLPPYTGERTPCAKCGHDQASTRFDGARLIRTCTRCTYAWDEAPVDEVAPKPSWVFQLRQQQPDGTPVAVVGEHPEHGAVRFVTTEAAQRLAGIAGQLYDALTGFTEPPTAEQLAEAQEDDDPDSAVWVRAWEAMLAFEGLTRQP